mmetsp:Transcript_10062/g.14539  ORF Transcript_10062/g.14539 Transcript_10062/m.14539 type:complete len:89 (-) Transcript_10062:4040-4306(-)
MYAPLYACHRETNVFEEGRVLQCRFEIAEKQYVTFAPVYGVPHSSAKNVTYQPADTSQTTYTCLEIYRIRPTTQHYFTMDPAESQNTH